MRRLVLFLVAAVGLSLTFSAIALVAAFEWSHGTNPETEIDAGHRLGANIVSPQIVPLPAGYGPVFIAGQTGNDSKDGLTDATAKQHAWAFYSKWNTVCPLIQSDFTMYVLETQPDNTDPIFKCAQLWTVDGGEAGAEFYIVGVPTQIATGTIAVNAADATSGLYWQETFTNVDGGADPCTANNCEILVENLSNVAAGDASWAWELNGPSGTGVQTSMISAPEVYPEGNSASSPLVNGGPPFPGQTVKSWATGQDAAAFTVPAANIVSLPDTVIETAGMRGGVTVKNVKIAEPGSTQGSSPLIIDEHTFLVGDIVAKHAVLSGYGGSKIGSGWTGTVFERGLSGAFSGYPEQYPGNTTGSGNALSRGQFSYASVIGDQSANTANPYACSMSGLSITETAFWSGVLGVKCRLFGANWIGTVWEESGGNIENLGYVDFISNYTVSGLVAPNPQHLMAGPNTAGTFDNVGLLWYKSNTLAATQFPIQGGFPQSAGGLGVCAEVQLNGSPRQGTFTLSSGVSTLTFVGAVAGDQIALMKTASGTSNGVSYIVSGVGTSGGFTVTSVLTNGSTQTGDNGTFQYEILSPCGLTMASTLLDTYLNTAGLSGCLCAEPGVGCYCGASGSPP